MALVREKQGWTFEKRYVVPSGPDDACKQCGDVHPYWTQNHEPIFFPDQWGDFPRVVSADDLIEQKQATAGTFESFVPMGDYEYEENEGFIEKVVEERELCDSCGKEYPAPHELHHDEMECRQNQFLDIL